MNPQLSKLDLMLLWEVCLKGPIHPAHLAENLALTEKAVTVLLIRLETAYYIERDVDGKRYTFVSSHRRPTGEDIAD